MMPRNLQELAEMLAERDGISVEEEMEAIKIAALDMETAFYNGSLDLAEEILASELSLEPDYLMLFIN